MGEARRGGCHAGVTGAVPGGIPCCGCACLPGAVSLPRCPCCLSPAQHHCAALVQVLIKFFMLPSDFKHERAFFNGFVHGSFVPGMPASLRDFPWRPLMHCGLATSPMTTGIYRLHLLLLRQSWGYSCSTLHAACAGVFDIFEAGELESGVDGGSCNPACIVMQRGSLSLADWLSKMESSPSALGRKNMLFQLAEGLNYLHARRVTLQLTMPHLNLEAVPSH